MQIDGIGAKALSALDSVGLQNTAGTASAGGSDEFANILSDAMKTADETDATATAGTEALLSGNVNDLHDVVIEAEKADIALRLTVQIRNKAIDAYSEVMRMQV